MVETRVVGTVVPPEGPNVVVPLAAGVVVVTRDEAAGVVVSVNAVVVSSGGHSGYLAHRPFARSDLSSLHLHSFQTKTLIIVFLLYLRYLLKSTKFVSIIKKNLIYVYATIQHW